MRRGFSRGGGSRSGGSRSGRAKPGSARAQSGRGRQPAKGQVKGGKAVQYAIESKTGETKYIGSTNNP